jgi:hypothetical protein
MNVILVNSSHALQTWQVWSWQESLHLHCHARFFPRHMRLPLPEVRSHLSISASFYLSSDSHRSGFHSSECSKTSSCRCRHQANPPIRTPPGISSQVPTFVVSFSGIEQGLEVGAVLRRRSDSLITAFKHRSWSSVSDDGGKKPCDLGQVIVDESSRKCRCGAPSCREISQRT